MKWDTELEKIGAKTKYPIGDGDHGYIKPEMYQKNGVPYIRVGDITWSGSIDRSKMVYISEEINNANPKSFLYPGDIVISKTGATIGKVAVIPDDMPISNTTSSIGKISLDKSKANSKYVIWCMRSQNFQTQMWRVSHKSAQPGFNIQDLKKFKIPLPPLATQKKIASILDAADELRQKDKALVAKYDELTQALFLDMFGDPVTNPKGWITKKGTEIFKYSSGKFNPTKNLDDSYSYPTYGGNGLTGKSKDYLIDFDTIIIGRVGAYCGSIHLSEGKSWVTDNAIYIKDFKVQVNLLFVYTVFLNYRINRFADFSGQPKITQKPLEQMQFISPPIKLQNQFAERVKAIEEQKSIAQASALKSEELFNSLLQKAFNGELV